MSLPRRTRARLSKRFVGELLAAITAASLPMHLCLAQADRLVKAIRPELTDVVRVREVRDLPFEEAQLGNEHVHVIDDFIKQELWPMIIYAVIVTGYSDRLEAANDPRLAQRRAAAVKNYLISRGIQPRHIFWEGRAQAMSAECADIRDHNRLVTCLAPNRRVTIEVVGKIPKPFQSRPRGTGA